MGSSRDSAATRWFSAIPSSTREGARIVLGVAVVVALTASGVSLVRLRQDHIAALAASARLHRFSVHLHAINAAEWQAVAEAPWRVGDLNVEVEERAAATLLGALPGDLPELALITERFAAYSVALEAERHAIAVRNIDGAGRIERESVTPAFGALNAVIERATLRLDDVLQVTIRRIDQMTTLVLAAAAGAAGLLLWLRWSQLAHARVLGAATLDLRRKEGELREAQRVSRTGSWDWDLATGQHTWSSELYRLLGRDPAGPTPTYAEHLACYTPESASQFAAALDEVRADGRSCALDLEVPAPDGVARWVLARGEPAFDAEGAIVGIHGTIQDITERKQVEEQLRRRESILNAVSMTAERFLRADAWRTSITEVLGALGSAAGADRAFVFESKADPSGEILVSQRHEWCAPGLSPRMGDPSLQSLPLRASGFSRWVDRLSRGDVMAAAVRALPAAEQPVLVAHGVRSIAMVPVLVGSDWWGVIGFETCQTERHWSPVELDALSAAARLFGEAIRRERDDESRARLESQLLNAQKMEALGQLAGGVAHDFNNLLTVILGNASRLDDVASGEAETRRLAGAIANAANRAARLTAQLLALGRRQTLQRRNLDVNAVVMSDVGMLRRLLGELIVVQTRYAPDLPPIHADEGMIGQIIMNLAVNARDAMPEGGTLTIATEVVEVRAGDGAGAAFDRPAVVLSVSDTGCGMDHVTKAHIFEPFFTTKAFGRGTGLGLATVYGIVKQHDGWIEVQSELGQGSTFRVFLPVAAGTDDFESTVETKTPAKTGTATILLVEDEPEVREVTAALLEKSGYRVIEASSGPEALEVWRTHVDRVDLLFTDMVMTPGMSGRDLAAQLRRENSDLKVIICSGYSQEPINQMTTPSSNDGFLQKPFTSTGLLDAVRRQLSHPD